MTRQADLIGRLRALLADEPSTREVSMFGGRSFMVRDRMVVSALEDGDLLVRVDAGRHDELTRQHGATQAEMGAGRSMGPGWIAVSAASVASDDGLSSWLDAALDHNHATTAGAGVVGSAAPPRSLQHRRPVGQHPRTRGSGSSGARDDG